jgi:peptide/nickel transport system substrate-binding protein
MRLVDTTRLRLAAGAVAVVAVAAACGSSGTGKTVSAAPTDHVLHLSFLQDPGQPPDPDIFYANQGLLLTTNLYDTLLTYKPGTADPTIVGDLATSWSASADNKTFTLHLRHGVFFHDGTPFTSAAVKPSFDRRKAVNQGPAYQVADVASVATPDPYTVTITLSESNASFLGYLASPYGPRMLSPTGLAAHAGKDNDETYLQTHDLGTGAYTLTKAQVGVDYQLAAYPKYWGAKPYFTSVDIPVETDLSTQQLLFDKGQLAAIMHDLTSSATKAYLKKDTIKTYSLPTQDSDFLYVNPHTGFLTTAANRVALEKAINVNQIYQQVFTGRAKIADQAYPAHMLPEGLAKQNIPYDPAALRTLMASLPANQRQITIGYDSQSADNQQVANLMSAQFAAAGVTAKVQGYPTSQIFGWINSVKGAPDLLLSLGWPDAPPPYTWAHISWDPDAGLNYLHCSDPAISKLLPAGLKTGADAPFSQAGELAVASGCWYNLVNQDDFMVAQPWLKGVEQAHTVSTPFSLNLAALSAG